MTSRNLAALVMLIPCALVLCVLCALLAGCSPGMMDLGADMLEAVAAVPDPPAPSEPWDLHEDESVIIPPDPPVVTFETNSAMVSDAAYQALMLFADRLAENVTLQVTGHADPRGDATYNQQLAAKRAQAVAAVLVRHGLDRLRVVARGEDDPIAGTTPEDGWAQSRRVEILYAE